MIGRTVSHYRIEEKLGSGGMGEVFLAEDTSLRRKVAVKFLSLEKQPDQTAHHRIIREARSAAGLEHSNICTIHEIGTVDGKDFIVMEYVDGQTLRDRLAKGPIPPDLALRIVSDVAEALEEAHENGIIHKDLKPENIMITRRGQTKILDFGLAMKMISKEAIESSADTLSTSVWGQEGGGTLSYMSPEQLLGESIDIRSDLFSLGIVFYEMLARNNPFKAANSVATCDRILHEEPKPIHQIAPEVPEDIGKLITQMLAKNPDDRPASARELLASLRELMRSEQIAYSVPLRIRDFFKQRRRAVPVIAGIVLFLLLAIFIPFLRYGGRQDLIGQLPERILVAVLPFEMIGGTPEHEAFGKGLIETINVQITKLTSQNSIRSIPAREIREKNILTVEEAYQELGANLVLVGSVRAAGGQYRINYVLVDAKSKQDLRGDTITASMSNPFDLEDQIIAHILQNLEVDLPDDRLFLALRTTRQPEAYSYYLTARGYLQQYQKPENIETAVEALNQALKQDPKFAHAHAALGEARWLQYEETKDVQRAEEALSNCNQALALDDGFAGGHICLGMAYNGTGKYEQAVQQYRRALDLDPASDAALRGLGSAYMNLGWIQEAEDTYLQAIELDPRYWAGYNNLGVFYTRLGRYSEAEEQFLQVTHLVPDHHFGYSNLGAIHLYEGRYNEAMEMLEHSVELRPSSEAYSNLGTACFLGRRLGDAASAYQEAIRLNDRKWVLWGNLGDAYYWDQENRFHAADAYRMAISLGEQEFQVNARDVVLLGFMAYYHAMLNEPEMSGTYAKLAIEQDPQNPELLYNLALTSSQLGEMEQVFDWLEKALAAGFSPTTIRDTPRLDHLRNAPEFQRLLQEN